MSGLALAVVQFLLASDHGVDSRLLHLLNPLRRLPPPLRLVAVNVGQVPVTVVRALDLLEVVAALAGLEVSPTATAASHPAQSQPGDFPLESDGQQVLLSPLFLQLFLFLSVLKVGLAPQLLVLLLAGVFPLLQQKPRIRAAVCGATERTGLTFLL